MKKSVFLALFLVLALIVPFTSMAQDEPLKIVLVINGVLGDKSFFDSAQRGMDMLLDEFDNIEVDTVELGIDPANWETGLYDVMSDSDSYDILITGTYQMIDFLAPEVSKYPDKYYMFFDATMPYDDPEICVDACANVYSITYAQNEGSFLAGVYAAAISESGIDGTNDAPVIGAIGGQQIPVIDDFIVGYEQGACLVNPDSQVIVQYAGGWNDPARGKEIALAMYEQDADIVFQIAGGTGVGVFEAAQEQGKYAIGVDSDQALIVQETDPDQADRILTSMLKNVDLSLYRAVTLHMDGELPYGTAENLGIAKQGVGLAINEIYDENTPDEVKVLMDYVIESVSDDMVEINSVFAEEPAEVGMPCSDMPETELDLSEFMMMDEG